MYQTENVTEKRMRKLVLSQEILADLNGSLDNAVPTPQLPYPTGISWGCGNSFAN